jgi:hypothetical protein
VLAALLDTLLGVGACGVADASVVLLLADGEDSEELCAVPELLAAASVCVVVDEAAAVTFELAGALTDCEALGEAVATPTASAVLGAALAAAGLLAGAGGAAGAAPLPAGGGAEVCAALAGAVEAALGLTDEAEVAVPGPADVVLPAVDGELPGAAWGGALGSVAFFPAGLSEIVSCGGADWLDWAGGAVVGEVGPGLEELDEETAGDVRTDSMSLSFRHTPILDKFG